MVKRYANMAVVYAVIAMIFGVFYREFTKLNHFNGQTNLSVMHTHYFLLGMYFFFMLMLAEKVFSFSDQKTGKLLIVYQLGLNITGLGFLMRGLTQVWGTELSKGLDATFSGIAGIGHILMGICIVLLLLNIQKVQIRGDTIQKMIPCVTPKYLLLIAGIVWMAAGINILRIGIPDFVYHWQFNIFYLVGAVSIFFIFMVLIFYRLVQKHTNRIMSMTDKKVPIFQFFDRKSYLIMFFMITGGLLLRSSQLLPPIAIGILYCGIGTSLEGAGVLFLQKFFVPTGRSNLQG